MSRRGYETVLVRDCTTGMESRETQPTLSQTRHAILWLEMFGQYIVASARSDPQPFGSPAPRAEGPLITRIRRISDRDEGLKWCKDPPPSAASEFRVGSRVVAPAEFSSLA